MKMFVPVALAAVAALALTACGSGSGGSSESTTIGVLLLNGDTYFTSVAKGVQEANAGGTTIVENYEGDAAKESQAIDNLVARGVDAIVTSPLDGTASAVALERAASSGIPVVCYNTCLDESAREGVISAFVLSDQAGMGEQTGQVAVERLRNAPPPVRFGVLHCDSFDICTQRREAFFRTLDDAGIAYEIVAQNEELVVDKAVPAAEDMLTAHPDITALWGANDGATAGLVRAVESSGRAGQVPVFGSDITPVLAGYLQADPPTLLTTTGQDGLATGAKAVEVVRTLLGGGRVEPFVQEVPVVNYSVDDLPAVQGYLQANAPS
jgi:simple sugar transport system substrate-binding protein